MATLHSKEEVAEVKQEFKNKKLKDKGYKLIIKEEHYTTAIGKKFSRYRVYLDNPNYNGPIYASTAKSAHINSKKRKVHAGQRVKARHARKVAKKVRKVYAAKRIATRHCRVQVKGYHVKAHDVKGYCRKKKASKKR